MYFLGIFLSTLTLYVNRLLLTSELRLFHYYVLLHRGFDFGVFLTGKDSFYLLQFKYFFIYLTIHNAACALRRGIEPL
jgi:hypothetical protein